MERLKMIVTTVIAILVAIMDFISGKRTTVLISSVREEPIDLTTGCEPVLSWYKVSYFYRVPYPGLPGMFKSMWVSSRIQAYSSSEAATKLGLKAGYNCFVSRQIGGV